MTLLVILLVLARNGMDVPAWSMGIACTMVAIHGLALVMRVISELISS